MPMKKTYDCELKNADRQPPMAMPFMYEVNSPDSTSLSSLFGGETEKIIVDIVLWNLSFYNHSCWQDFRDKNILRPDVDLVLERYEFTAKNMADAEREAIEFVRQWWIDNPVKNTKQYNVRGFNHNEEMVEEILDNVTLSEIRTYLMENHNLGHEDIDVLIENKTFTVHDRIKYTYNLLEA